MATRLLTSVLQCTYIFWDVDISSRLKGIKQHEVFKEAYASWGHHGVTVLSEQLMLYFRSLKRSAGRHVQEVQVWTFDSSVGIEQRTEWQVNLDETMSSTEVEEMRRAKRRREEKTG